MLFPDIYKKFLIGNPSGRNLTGIIALVFIFIAGLMVFQDYLEAQRVGRAFYFSESFLFKTIWFLFIPILPVLYSRLKKQRHRGHRATFPYIIIPVFIHYLILPVVFLSFTTLFYGGKYDLYKILTYTLANDLWVLIVVYSTFVLGCRYVFRPSSSQISAEENMRPPTLVINNGKNNTILVTAEIEQIVAATPYVEIHLENKKYLHTATLKSLRESLSQNDFVRVHKSAIVNINKVCSFKSRLNGDYDLRLNNGQITRLSRTYAADFRQRFEQINRVRG